VAGLGHVACDVRANRTFALGHFAEQDCAAKWARRVLAPPLSHIPVLRGMYASLLQTTPCRAQ